MHHQELLFECDYFDIIICFELLMVLHDTILSQSERSSNYRHGMIHFYVAYQHLWLYFGDLTRQKHTGRY